MPKPSAPIAAPVGRARRLAQTYRRFGEVEVAGTSPVYERVAVALSESEEALRAIEAVPARKRHPTVILAAAGSPMSRSQPGWRSGPRVLVEAARRPLRSGRVRVGQACGDRPSSTGMSWASKVMPAFLACSRIRAAKSSSTCPAPMAPAIS